MISVAVGQVADGGGSCFWIAGGLRCSSGGIHGENWRRHRAEYSRSAGWDGLRGGSAACVGTTGRSEA